MNQICNYCRSEISNECYVCPVCKKHLNTFRLKKDNPHLKWFIILLVSFSFAMVVPRYLASRYMIDNYLFKTAEEHHLKIIFHELKKTKTEVVIIGEIQNNGQHSLSLVEVEARIYDKNSKLIDVEKGFVSGRLLPGKNGVFKISRCCNKEDIDNGLGDFDRYELSIVNGFINR